MEKKNFFSKKVAIKTVEELKKIIENNSLQEDYKEAAKWELEHRLESGDLNPRQIIEDSKYGKESDYKEITKTFPMKFSFGLPPIYKEKLQTRLKKGIIHIVVNRVFEKLSWEIVYYDISTIEALRRSETSHDDSPTEKIIVSINTPMEIEVKSKSLRQDFCDWGKNSKRVQLFNHVFQELEQELNLEQLDTLITEFKRKENWDDYEVPEILPPPSSLVLKESYIIFPMLSGLVVSIILSIIYAYIVQYEYMDLLYEIGLGLGLAYGLSFGMKWGNYTNYNEFIMIIGGCALLIVFSNQYFQLLQVMDQGKTWRDYMEVQGDWIGLLWIICFQFAIIYYVSQFRIIFYLRDFIMKRVPKEVIEFTIYHHIKGKEEIEIRKELTEKGWIEKRHQDFIYEALGVIQFSKDLYRR